MPEIALLSQDTIDKIAAGEVVERPSSVVKELVENAIDAGSTAVTIEIKDGGTSFIRITDNGCGIARDQVQIAFLRHSTSKIRTAEDLVTVNSLGFRGEALSSIAAISRVEMITKSRDEVSGTRYVIEGSKEIKNEEIGAPEGTTFLVRDLFYNTPARRKFLKTATTEGNYISDIVEKLALSHPQVSFKYIANNQTKLHTSGNGNRKDLIYHIYGREIAASLIEVSFENDYFAVSGFIGKPVINRGNRNYENYFINGRYVKSNLIAKAIEDAYKNFLMQHQYPFTVLYFNFKSALDVNVHPTKMELRFDHNQEVYLELCNGLFGLLSGRDMIPEVPVTDEKKEEKREYKEPVPEPFEQRRLNDIRKAVSKDSPYTVSYPQHKKEPSQAIAKLMEHPFYGTKTAAADVPKADDRPVISSPVANAPEKEHSGEVSAPAVEKEEAVPAKEQKPAFENMTLDQISPDFLTKDGRRKHKIIGQLFDTYWIVEYMDKMFIIDQHAAHEKVLFERNMARLKMHEFTSQRISPPIIISLDAKESAMLAEYLPQIEEFGYEVEPFGGREYMISAVPDNIFRIDMKQLFIEMLDDFSNLTGRETPDLILEKVASMSCKAAVKGHDKLSIREAEELIDELLTLDNPYNCPHGRPTIISMTKYELEKKFKRIV